MTLGLKRVNFKGALERGAIHRATTELVAERDKQTLLMCVTCQVIYVDYTNGVWTS